MADNIYDSNPNTLDELRARNVLLPEIPGRNRPGFFLWRDVKKHASMESAGTTENGLKFLRSAVVDGVQYYVGLTAIDEYVYVELFENNRVFGLESCDGLTPEQFLVREYLRNQWDIELDDEDDEEE